MASAQQTLRALQPQLRQGNRMDTIAWARAARIFASRMQAIIAENGPSSVALLIYGWPLNEEVIFSGSFYHYGMGCLAGIGCANFNVSALYGEQSAALGWPHGNDPHGVKRIAHGIAEGRIKALWAIGTDAGSADRPGVLEPVLGQLEFLAWQGGYLDDPLARHADLRLPSASLAEKEGTILSSENLVGEMHRLRMPPGQSLADFYIVKLFAEIWGCGTLFDRWMSPADVRRDLETLGFAGVAYDSGALASMPSA